MLASQNVLILSSNTGGGHRSAAHALEDSFTNLLPDRILVKIAQVLEDSSDISRRMSNLYNFLLRDHQHLMKYYYWAVNHLKPNESRFVLKQALGYGLRLVDKVTPNAIVSVHPMTQHFCAYILRRLGLLDKIPFITVVTDPCYGFWRGWACDDVQQYYVATEDAKQQLIDYGVGSHKIQIVGMPVHSRFQAVDEARRYELYQKYGLDPDKFTVFLNSGWVGGGNIPQIYEALARAQGLDIQAVFLAGRNDELLRYGHEVAQSADFSVRVLGFTENIQEIMNVSDIMVSKMGGLTTFEALACHLPIIGDTVTHPMPQEEQTGRYIEKTGAGLLLHQPDRIVSVVQSLVNSPEEYLRMREAARTHGRAGASDRIASDVLSYLANN